MQLILLPRSIRLLHEKGKGSVKANLDLNEIAYGQQSAAWRNLFLVFVLWFSCSKNLPFKIEIIRTEGIITEVFIVKLSDDNE